MDNDTLRHELRDFLNVVVLDEYVQFTIEDVVEKEGFTRSLISYNSREGDRISAYLLLPKGKGLFGAVLVNHQHHGERHFGKSEVCGLVGDPFQAFGPALVKHGIAVLAPDSICFEDRRRNVAGTEPDESDVAQHYNEMCYRLLRGDSLMRKVLDDAARGISLLRHHPRIDSDRIGVLGHSYGGSTVLFHMALDERIRFGCSSGAACSYQYKMAHEIGIEMSMAIPGFAVRYDIDDLVKCIAPRPLLLVSATEDKYSMDAAKIFEEAQKTYAAMGQWEQLEQARYVGSHPLTEERFGRIVEWLVNCAG